jgi:hypothetical protein
MFCSKGKTGGTSHNKNISFSDTDFSPTERKPGVPAWELQEGHEGDQLDTAEQPLLQVSGGKLYFTVVWEGLRLCVWQILDLMEAIFLRYLGASLVPPRCQCNDNTPYSNLESTWFESQPGHDCPDKIFISSTQSANVNMKIES